MSLSTRRTASWAGTALLTMAASGAVWFGLADDAAPRVARPLAESDPRPALFVTITAPRVVRQDDSRSRFDRHARSPVVDEPPQDTTGEASSADSDAAAQPRSDEAEFLSALYTQAHDAALFADAQARVDAATAAQADGTVQLFAMDCGSSMCRVQLAYTQPASFSEFMDRFPEFLRWNAEMNFFTQGNANSGYLTTLYVARQSDELAP